MTQVYLKILMASLLLLPTYVVGQMSSRKTNPCESSETKEFDFMLGEWRGVEKVATAGKEGAITSTSKIQVKKVLNGCAIQEDWEFEDRGKRLFNATLLRSYNAETRKWLLSYVDDQLNHQFYEGHKESGQWRFLRERLVEGKPVLVRITWTSASHHKVEQTIERSEDNGKTWAVRATVSYSRQATAPNSTKRRRS